MEEYNKETFSFHLKKLRMKSEGRIASISEKRVTNSYRSRAKFTHPDTSPKKRPTHEEFVAVQTAYEYVRNYLHKYNEDVKAKAPEKIMKNKKEKDIASETIMTIDQNQQLTAEQKQMKKDELLWHYAFGHNMSTIERVFQGDSVSIERIKELRLEHLAKTRKLNFGYNLKQRRNKRQLENHLRWIKRDLKELYEDDGPAVEKPKRKIYLKLEQRMELEKAEAAKAKALENEITS